MLLKNTFMLQVITAKRCVAKAWLTFNKFASKLQSLSTSLRVTRVQSFIFRSLSGDVKLIKTYKNRLILRSYKNMLSLFDKRMFYCTNIVIKIMLANLY